MEKKPEVLEGNLKVFKKCICQIVGSCGRKGIYTHRALRPRHAQVDRCSMYSLDRAQVIPQ